MRGQLGGEEAKDEAEIVALAAAICHFIQLSSKTNSEHKSYSSLALYTCISLYHSHTLPLSLSLPRTRLVGAIFNLLLQQFGAVKGNASSAFALSWAKLLEHIGKGRKGGEKEGDVGRKLPKKWPLAIDTTNNPNRERATAKVRQANFRLARQLFCLVVNCSQLGAAWGKVEGGMGGIQLFAISLQLA